VSSFDPAPLRGTYFQATGGGVPVTVEVGTQEIHARGEGVDVRLPLDSMELSLGGTNRSQLVCRAPVRGETHELYLERSGLLAALVDEAPPWFTDRVRGLVGEHRRSWAVSRAAIAIALVAFVPIAWVGGWLLYEFTLVAIPPSVEQDLGGLIFEQLEPEELVDPALQTLVEELVAKLLVARPDQPYAFEVVVVPDAEVNAFALPGGYLLVNTGLIAASESPEELAGILGHEISHVLARHSLRQALGNLGMLTLVGLLFDPGSALVQLSTVISLAELKFSRDHEAEADVMGVQLLHDAGVSPADTGKFFQRLSERPESLPGVVSFLSTHPADEARAAGLTALVADLPGTSYQPIDVDWAAMRGLARGE
jgi:predicted Zn-dependent protease